MHIITEFQSRDVQYTGGNIILEALWCYTKTLVSNIEFLRLSWYKDLQMTCKWPLRASSK